MKILLVSRFFPYIGGREVLVMSLAQKLSENHKVIVATPDIGRVSKDYQIVSNDNNSLSRCLHNFKPDIINSHTFYLTPQIIKLAKPLGIPIALTIHGDIFGYGSESDKKTLRSIIPNLDYVITVCDHGKKQMIKNGVSRNKIIRIYPGIDTSMFSEIASDKTMFRKAFQLPTKEKFIFITPARMIKYKGIEILLEAISDLNREVRSQCLFWITTPATRYRIDEMIYTKKILKRADYLGIKDNITISFNDYSSMMFAYKAADAFILPSLTEQLPVSILEAMASGLPIIATDVGGVSEVIDNNTGILVPASNANKLSKAIQDIFYFKKDLSIDKAIQVVSSRFNINRMTKEYIKLYTSLKL